MPEYILDARGRRRSALLSVKECAEITDRMGDLRQQLGISGASANAREEAVAKIEQRLRAVSAMMLPVPTGAGAPSKAATGEGCGARLVTKKGKTVACLLTMREFSQVLDLLEDLEDSVELKEAEEAGGEFMELDEFIAQIRGNRKA